MARKRDMLTRRQFLASATAAVALGQDLKPLEVAYAGSMTSVMEGPVKAAAAKALNVDLRGRAQGASGLANLIASGTILPDVFISVTPGPMQTVIKAGKASSSTPFARTEMVIAWSPTSRFASHFRNSGADWWKTLENPEMRFGRTDPRTDPQGRNIIFVMELAARYYKQPDLQRRVLGDTDNPKQIFSEPSIQARLQSGQLDAASAYKIQPGPFHIPWIALPNEINLSGEASQDISLTIDGRTYRPEPLVYSVAVLNDAPHPREARAFVEWLLGADARAIFAKYDYDPA